MFGNEKNLIRDHFRLIGGFMRVYAVECGMLPRVKDAEGSPMKTKIHTARSLNKQDWKGFPLYITRTAQRCLKYKAERFGFLAPTKEMFEEIKQGDFDSYLEFLNTPEPVYLHDAILTYYDVITLRKIIEWHKEVTLLCFCENPERCHRTILAKFMVERFSDRFELGDLK